MLAAVNFNCDLRYNRIMPQMTKTEKIAAIEAAMDHVFTDVVELVKQCAGEFAISNMGQSLEDFMYGGPTKPESLLYGCYSSFYQQSESDEMADGTNDEYKSWVKSLTKEVKRVQKAKLPLTPRNVRAAFMKEGVFATKK